MENTVFHSSKFSDFGLIARMMFQKLIPFEFRDALSERRDFVKKWITLCREESVIYGVASAPVVGLMELEVKQLSDLTEKENMFTDREKVAFIGAIRFLGGQGNNWRHYSNPLELILRERLSNPPWFIQNRWYYYEGVRQLEQKLKEAIGEVLYLEKDWGGVGQHMALNSDYPHCPQPEFNHKLPGAFVINGGQLQATNHGVSAEAVNEFAYPQFAVKEKKLYSDDHSKTVGTWDPQPGGSFVSNFSRISFCSSALGSSSISSRPWLLDSGASHHVCCFLNSFQSLVLSVNYDVTLPNGHTVSIAGTGSVRLSDHLTLENVLFVPEFHFNLVSVSALTHQHHYSVIFTSDIYVILDLTQAQMIGMGRQSGNLYILDSSNLFSSFP